MRKPAATHSAPGQRVAADQKRGTQYRDAETIYPLGQYSMCPSLSADRVA